MYMCACVSWPSTLKVLDYLINYLQCGTYTYTYVSYVPQLNSVILLTLNSEGEPSSWYTTSPLDAVATTAMGYI